MGSQNDPVVKELLGSVVCLGHRGLQALGCLGFIRWGLYGFV